MLKQAKIKLRQLLLDDSGIAMAFTIMVFLVFFLLCVSVYAMTENIRQKMELQNACDTAAYSGAMVQADMLSRIAVLNRALSWTYLQTNKRQMDYLVGLWASQVHSRHTADSSMVESKNVGCPAHRVRGIHHYASISGTSVYYIKMRKYTESASNVYERVARGDLTSTISFGNSNMQTIMAEIGNIRNNLNTWISSAVDHAWNESSMPSTTAQKKLFLGGTVYNGSSVPTYFENVNNEATLLAFAGYSAEDMGNGQGIWWNLISNNVIQRAYTGGLFASYNCHWEIWNCSSTPHYPESVITSPCQIQFVDSYSGIPVTGTRLSQTFFGKAGSIVVAAKRTMTNPFSVFGMSGLYDAFDVKDDNGASVDMWVVSAARAGVRLRAQQSTAGYYVVQYPGDTVTADGGYRNGIWNLCEEDWDGVLIPVSRAWNETGSGTWTGGQTSETLLKDVLDNSGLDIRTSYTGSIGNNMRH